MWMGGGDDLKHENWGRSFLDGTFKPKTMDSLQAPESLMKVIRCQCKGDYHTKKCSCRKHEVDCSTSCSVEGRGPYGSG